MHEAGEVTPFGWLLVGIAFAADIGLIGGGGRARGVAGRGAEIGTTEALGALESGVDQRVAGSPAGAHLSWIARARAGVTPCCRAACTSSRAPSQRPVSERS